MQGLKGIGETIASAFNVMYNTTLPLEVLLSLQQDENGFGDFLWPNYSYIVVLSIITLWLFFYNYMWLPINWVKDYSDIGYDHIKGLPKRGKTKREFVEEVRQRRQIGNLPPVFPNGWFALLESTDLKAGQVKHVQALGENFAVMRTSNGDAHVLDAYCPHLGANMAVGGVVKKDCLECPFHGWQFRGDDGTCSHIPYSDKVPKTAVVKKWTSNEINGFLYVWYHAEGDPPSWQLENIPELEAGQLWYRGRCELFINAHIQDIVENLADKTHFEAIHTASVAAGSDIGSCKRLIHSFLKHNWTLDWKQNTNPGESHKCSLSIMHNLRLFGKISFLPKGMTSNQAGPGTGVLKNDWGCVVMTMTPVEPLMIRMVFRIYFRLPHYFLGGIIFYGMLISVERDIMVWNHKKYVMQPILTKEEEAITRIIRWFSQFYTENSPRFSFQQSSLDW